MFSIENVFIIFISNHMVILLFLVVVCFIRQFKTSWLVFP